MWREMLKKEVCVRGCVGPLLVVVVVSYIYSATE